MGRRGSRCCQPLGVPSWGRLIRIADEHSSTILTAILKGEMKRFRSIRYLDNQPITLSEIGAGKMLTVRSWNHSLPAINTSSLSSLSQATMLTIRSYPDNNHMLNFILPRQTRCLKKPSSMTQATVVPTTSRSYPFMSTAKELCPCPAVSRHAPKTDTSAVAGMVHRQQVFFVTVATHADSMLGSRPISPRLP